jgi:hypothetical protein
VGAAASAPAERPSARFWSARRSGSAYAKRPSRRKKHVCSAASSSSSSSSSGRKYRSERSVYSSSPVNSALRVERHAERHELRAVGIEPSRERLVAHLLVALDVRLDVPSRQRTTFRHQERDQRELTDQLVGVMAHAVASLAQRVTPRLSSARGAGATGSSRGSARASAGTPCPCAWSRDSGQLHRRTRRLRSAPRRTRPQRRPLS